VLETRIRIRLQRDSQRLTLQGWARDLSESGLGAFVAQALVLGELVTLEIPLPNSDKQVIPAKVARALGTEYGFQFTALSPEQRAQLRMSFPVTAHRHHRRNRSSWGTGGPVDENGATEGCTEGGIMIELKSKKKVIAKLIVARDEMEDALQLSVPAARYDPVLIPQAARNELSVLRDDLDRIIGKLEGEP
jgi:c-di-GMP-binding flagellar brake protein YcgR